MRRLPGDFPTLVARRRRTDDVLCVLCTGQLADPHPPFILPALLVVPPLARRRAELDRIIAEYADDAIAELAAPKASFNADDQAWVRDHAAASLAEVEATMLRLVAIHASRNLSHAAARLGMAPVSLSRWLGRRELLSMMPGDDRSHG
jgi:DNA-binding protein Fis